VHWLPLGRNCNKAKKVKTTNRSNHFFVDSINASANAGAFLFLDFISRLFTCVATITARIIFQRILNSGYIAMDERTAVCIDESGNAKVFGSSRGYFLAADAAKTPEQSVNGLPLIWTRANEAVRVYDVQGSAAGNGVFSVSDFEPSKASGGAWYWWWVSNGTWQQAPI
jgi:hypothetical protein